MRGKHAQHARTAAHTAHRRIDRAPAPAATQHRRTYSPPTPSCLTPPVSPSPAACVIFCAASARRLPAAAAQLQTAACRAT